MSTLKGLPWRYVVLAVVALAPVGLLLSLDPIPQDPSYHLFADTRRFFGIPNFFDVVSNVPFLLVGIAGIGVSLKQEIRSTRPAWFVTFLGITLVSLGSAYYHWAPSNASLMWDRLPMTVGFMGLFAAILGEYVDTRIGTVLLYPLVALGIGSVVYWRLLNDLRPYAWVQFFPLLVLPLVMLLFRSRFSHRWMIVLAIGLYALAKFAEVWDLTIFDGTGRAVSGHTVKHVFAASSCLSLVLMLRFRKADTPAP